ncbi:MAG: hypothetical protein AMXMBFR4_24330 [Candidatus Hydrogenedentota bacterium]
MSAFVKLPPVVIVAGVAFSLALQLVTPRGDVFFSGDGGMKSLMTRQYASGDLHIDLRLSDEPWVQSLWDRGLHPLVYGSFAFNIDGRCFSVFPYPFPMVTAPFYAAFGSVGYFIVPLVSLWATWSLVFVALKRAGLDPIRISILLTVLIFAMPLTLYGAMFWEHTLGVALAFGGAMYTLGDRFEPGKPAPAVIAGVVMGSATWFRPETLAWMAAFFVATFIWKRVAMGNRNWIAYWGAATAAVALFFVCNYLIYGHPLGTHGMQMDQIDPPPGRVDVVLDRLDIMARDFARFAPIVWFAVAGIVCLAVTRKLHVRSNTVYLATVLVLFVCGTARIVPNEGGYQIGPRFLFAGLPLLVMVCGHVWKEFDRVGWNWMKSVALVLVLLCVVVGAKRSALDGTRYLAANYRERVMPAIDVLRSRDEGIVAVQHAAISAELASQVGPKTFFQVRDRDHLEALMDALRAQGVDRFIYVAFGDPDHEHDSPIQHTDSLPLQIEPLGRHGEHFYFYVVYLREIIAMNSSGIKTAS